MKPGVRDKISEMSINASGTRDISRVLGVSKNSVTKELKKKAKEVQDVNPRFIGKEVEVEIVGTVSLQSELDEQWSYVGNKKIKGGCGMRLRKSVAMFWRSYLEEELIMCAKN